MGGSHHHHHHHHDLKNTSDDSLNRIRIAFLLNMGFALVELIGGLWSGSFAIVADAIHDFGDSMSLALALFLHKAAQKGPNDRLTYGYQRYSILSSLLTGLTITVGSVVILYEAIPQLWGERDIPHVPGMVGLALLGIAVNGFAAYRLSRGQSHNEKVLTWHLIEDFLGWVVVLIGAVAIHFFQVTWLDPLLAICIALFVIWNVIKSMKEPLDIILQTVPSKDDVETLKTVISKQKGVERIVHLHAWTLDGQQHVLSLGLKTNGTTEPEGLKRKIRQLAQQKGYRHITIEVGAEDVACHDDTDHDTAHEEHPDGSHGRSYVYKHVESDGHHHHGSDCDHSHTRDQKGVHVHRGSDRPQAHHSHNQTEINQHSQDSEDSKTQATKCDLHRK